MNRRRHGAICLALFSLIAWPVFAQEEAFQDDDSGGESRIARPTEEDLKASRQAASEALGVVAVLADPLLAKLGLDAEGARQAATLGDPIPVFKLNLNQLKALGSADEISKALSRSDEMFYPIEVGGHVVSSVSVERGDDGWQMVSIGQSHLTAKLLKIHRVLELTGQHVIAVNVPSIYQMYLVNASARFPIFIPVYDVPVMQLLAMQTLGHGEWFDKIKGMVENFQSALHQDNEEDGESSEASTQGD